MSERQMKWDRRYIALAREVGTWSKDPSTQVGAVLVRPNNSVASTGFNGFPSGHDDSPELYLNREYKYKHVVHAEDNALRFYCGVNTKGKFRLSSLRPGFTLYTSFPTCPNCMTLCGEVGVSRVVGPPLDPTGKTQEWQNEWKQRILKSSEIAARYGIQWDVVGE